MTTLQSLFLGAGFGIIALWEEDIFSGAWWIKLLGSAMISVVFFIAFDKIDDLERKVNTIETRR